MLVFSDFKLLSPTGLEVGPGLMSLLTVFNRTVCSMDDFDNATADAICREMGSSGHLSWTFGINWPIQNDFLRRLSLSQLSCLEDGSGPTVCEYDLDRGHDCSSDEDVFLTCNVGDENGESNLFNHEFYFLRMNSCS